MQNDTILTVNAADTAVSSRGRTLGAATLSALLGLVLVWGVGFSQAEAFHNAAHDTRHSNAFPCH